MSVVRGDSPNLGHILDRATLEPAPQEPYSDAKIRRHQLANDTTRSASPSP